MCQHSFNASHLYLYSPICFSVAMFFLLCYNLHVVIVSCCFQPVIHSVCFNFFPRCYCFSFSFFFPLFVRCCWPIFFSVAVILSVGIYSHNVINMHCIQLHFLTCQLNYTYFIHNLFIRIFTEYYGSVQFSTLAGSVGRAHLAS